MKHTRQKHAPAFALIFEHDAALENVLSPEQYATFRKSREEHARGMHKRHHSPHPE